MSPSKKLWLLCWSMRYEWVMCALGAYLALCVQTRSALVLSAVCWLSLWPLKFLTFRLFNDAMTRAAGKETP